MAASGKQLKKLTIEMDIGNQGLPTPPAVVLLKGAGDANPAFDWKKK